MNVQAFDSTTPTTNSNDQSLSGLTGDSFLTLLTAQLKEQDPTAPTDPTAFVGQLVQFNSLEQLLQIKEILQGQTPDGSQSVSVAKQQSSQQSAQTAQLLATA